MIVVPINLLKNEEESIAYFSSVSLNQYGDFFRHANDFLHSNELNYFSNLKYERRQKSFLVGRYVCKKVLSYYLKESNLTKIEIISGVFGQPIVRHLSEKTPSISLSHNDEFAIAIAFPEIFPIGIDIESANKCKISIMQTILTDREVAFTKSGIFTKELLSTLFWTAKEALSKVIRCGLMVPFEILEVDTESLEKEISYFNRNTFKLNFVNFPFLKSYSWIFNDQIVSIVLPKSLELDLNIKMLKSILQ